MPKGESRVRRKRAALLAGPLLFLLFLLLPLGGLSLTVRATVGTVAWMSCWWITMPVNPAITAFLPVICNALFNLAPMDDILKSYAAELVFLLAGANVITIAWEETGVDRRIAAKVLSLIGPSVRQQIAVWFLAATLLSAVLPNTVVAAILCSIAISMLRFIGEGDVRRSKVAPLILIAIVWGANNGGMATPLGGSMNLISVSHLETVIGREFFYSDWVIQLAPFTLTITAITLVYLVCRKFDQPSLGKSRAYFEELYRSFPKISRSEIISLVLFFAAAVLAFTRQLYQDYLPGLKPAFVFLLCGLLTFLISREDGRPILSWEKAEKNIMWGLIFLFAGGTALGALVNGSGTSQVLADFIASLNIHSELLLIFILVAFIVVLSDVINNTSCAAVTIPIVIGIAQGMDLPVIPYVFIASVAYNISYTLPTSIRAIPIGYGLDPRYMFKKGLVLTPMVIAAITAIGYLLLKLWPGFGVLSG